MVLQFHSLIHKQKRNKKIGHVHAFRDDEKDDIDEAIKWWKRAAKSGNEVAQFSLAQSYWEGHGVEQNMEHAYTWAMVSADKKSKSQRRYLVNATTYKKSLTADQATSATKAVQVCLDSGFEDCPYK
jgi:TPR repeat protein